MAKKLLTPDEVKAKFRSDGMTITEWAKKRGYRRNAVYRVLNGFDKAHFGLCHQIAVDLGLKQPNDQHAA